MFGHLLDSPRTIYLAAFASLFLGLFFTFVWAPHPWTWQGIDQYHDLARALARGEGFRTTDVPWGYAYYIAFFYALFGEHPWLPILGQVAANATMPIMLHAIVRPLAGPRTAVLSALIVGIFSFNTVYASTQISDAVCSVLFLAAVWCFFRAHASGSLGMFALSGLLVGLSAQFRPNLLLLPAVVAAFYVVFVSRRRLLHAMVFAAVSFVALVPWVVRNYQLTGVFLPTSTHGAIQLWYGSLQTGRYLENFSENPRTAFAPAPFDYTSLTDTPIIVSIDASRCAPDLRERLTLTYWTNQVTQQQVSPRAVTADALEARIPGQPDGATVYWRIDPSPASAPPFVYFVSTVHTRDLDAHNDFFDVFDLIRLMLGTEVDRKALETAVRTLIGGDAPVSGFESSGDSVTLQVYDGSHVRVPRSFDGDLADLEVEKGLAQTLVGARRRRAGEPNLPECLAGRVRVNDVFYRRELHQMRRYTALAMDNIRREPAAFAAAAAYRSLRLFVVRPSGDRGTTYQFASGRLVYAGGLLLSLTYLLLFLAGVAIAWRRRSPLLPLLVPIVYVPLTICFVLTNQRYSVTVQPLMFAFVAFAIVSWWEKRGLRA